MTIISTITNATIIDFITIITISSSSSSSNIQGDYRNLSSMVGSIQSMIWRAVCESCVLWRPWWHVERERPRWKSSAIM